MATSARSDSIEEFRARCEGLVRQADYKTYGHEAWDYLRAARTDRSLDDQERLLRMAYAYYFISHSLVQTIRFGPQNEREAMIAFQFCLGQGLQCFRQALEHGSAERSLETDEAGGHHTWREKLLELDRILESNHYHEEAAYEAEKLRSSGDYAGREAAWQNL